ncbi:uncharacterized protein LOC115725692 [Cannabis sativa]|uniref:uncharacterized protein LOC115725692 n=1 Tax=Cannabis sativa TaxID=3483 RepID=UPI0029CA35CF|nr:uncharacterized protein LOC115725692 [Cannabis sativa]
MAMDKWLLLSKLRTAVKKVKVLINLNVHRWRVASIIGGRPSLAPNQRRFSFNDRPGLIAAYEEEDEEEEEGENKSRESSEEGYYSATGSSSSNSRSGSRSGSGSVVLQLQRTTSYPNSNSSSPSLREETCSNYDVDQRAEMFINNFRRQLQMERQISLQIRYSNRLNSFNWRSP